ncbi:LysR family transcriptional regulator [Nocardioides anomalus]|uniref:LysR family transcriptional regulator n=1 Tax=Nocardioides anomalus TaxID=2712223 RepID=A0A6G6W9X9_9ACTN|nr:LysR family transcriptional regulator [Nocardioides anomalus]QIG42032.1 LysR family transcriptional regulator [Nocardioides anomalus]
MELRHLRAFLAVADERHFGRAAERLHLAQPALSQQVKQLEREVGLALFERTTRRVELSEAGHRFEPHARSVLAAVEHASADLALLADGRAGRVAVGFIGTATYDVLPRVAREVRDRLPDVELDLHGELLSPALVDRLVAGQLDLAILRPDGITRPDVLIRDLRRERLVAVLPAQHPLARRRRLDLADLAEEAFVVHPAGDRSSMHGHVLAACARAGFRPTSTIEVSETATLAVFVAAGLGVALVPEPVRSLALAGVAYVPLADPPEVRLALASRAGDPAAATERVAGIIAAAVGAG